MRKGSTLACAALLTLSCTGGSRAQDRSGVFDFYVLALSWSPTWCVTEGQVSGSDQCSEAAGHGFIVHGLWPQHERGYPEFCATAEPQRVPQGLAADMLDLMPDRNLVFGQWRKHGTCTGLTQSGYFETIRSAAALVTIPEEFLGLERQGSVSAEEVENAFLAANPRMQADGIAVSCEAGLMEEVRICMTRDLSFRDCDEVDRRGCRQSGLRIPAPG